MPINLQRSFAVNVALLCAAIAVLSDQAIAREKRAPVPARRVLVSGPSDDQIKSESEDLCNTDSVYGISKRGYLSVRSSPSTKAKELDRLPNEMPVFRCEAVIVGERVWIGIVYTRVGHGEECGPGVESVPAKKSYAYSGPCWSGWVAAPYLRGAG